MEEIIKHANELGLMLQNTEAYQQFQINQKKLTKDTDSYNLYQAYEKTLIELDNKRKLDAIEQYEIEELKEMQQTIDANTIIQDFLLARNEYIKILTIIQNEIEELPVN